MIVEKGGKMFRLQVVPSGEPYVPPPMLTDEERRQISEQTFEYFYRGMMEVMDELQVEEENNRLLGDAIVNVTISKNRYQNLLDAQEKLNLLEAGGVSKWDWYGEALAPWFKKQERREMFLDVIDSINDLLVEADVSEPAGSGCGYSIQYDEDAMVAILEQAFKRAQEIDDE